MIEHISKMTGSDLIRCSSVLGPFCADHHIIWKPFDHGKSLIVFVCEEPQVELIDKFIKELK